MGGALMDWLAGQGILQGCKVFLCPQPPRGINKLISPAARVGSRSWCCASECTLLELLGLSRL